jgi:Ca2+-binding RTX toxin-like protein
MRKIVVALEGGLAFYGNLLPHWLRATKGMEFESGNAHALHFNSGDYEVVLQGSFDTSSVEDDTPGYRLSDTVSGMQISNGEDRLVISNLYIDVRHALRAGGWGSLGLQEDLAYPQPFLFQGTKYNDVIKTDLWTYSVANGGAGNDTIIGQGKAEMHGGSGDDTLKTGSWPSRLYGEDGNDVLCYGKIEDGGNGNDVLIANDDTKLIGGAGKDRFVNDIAAEDCFIVDFEQGKDVIDLRKLPGGSFKTDTDKFHFLGSDKFTGDDMEIRVVQDYKPAYGTVTMVKAVIDADTLQEFNLFYLEGKIDLDRSDFLL